MAGQYRRAAEAAEAAVAIAHRAGLRFEECLHLHNVGEQYLRLGETERARAALTASHGIAIDIGSELRLYDEALLAYLDARSTRLEEIAEDLRLRKKRNHEMHVRYWLGRLLAAQGSPHARREFARALDLERDLKVRAVAEDCAAALAGLPASA